METVETHDDEFALTRALEPLLAIKGSVYACLGNHDYETYERSKKAFLDNGIKLLEDDQIVVDTKLGPVQIIGSSFTFGGNDVAKKHVERLCEKFKKLEHTKARFMLIHNPSVFSYIPKDEHVCVWSGHLHGGQIGFRRWTILQLLAKSPLLKRMKTEFPDQGLYARGRNQLYAHRGTGHYGFPLRLG
ncbi:metalophosphatase, partial [Acrasis kona]